MENKKNQVPQTALPSFFKDVEIIGIMDAEMCRDLMAHQDTNAEIHADISAPSTPSLLTTKNVKKIYQSNDFESIKKLEAKAQKDLQPIYDNLTQNKEKAWTKVRSGGEEFFMSWSSTGSMWVRFIALDCQVNDNETTYSSTIEIGTYSSSSNILGVHTYNISAGTAIAGLILAFIVAIALTKIVAVGLGFIVSAFSLMLTNAAYTLGFAAFTFAITTTAISTVAFCLVFVVVFIGLSYLWDWLNRKYTIRLQLFNWNDNDWIIDGSYHDNSKIASAENISLNNVIIPKLKEAGSSVTPPGFQPVEILDSVCSYVTIVWENDNTFMEGCAMALRIKKDNSNEGFMWAFDCPRFRDNTHAAQDGRMDPDTYIKNVAWNSNPKSFSITSTSSNIPVAFGLDSLSGAEDNLYNVNIHIGMSES